MHAGPAHRSHVKTAECLLYLKCGDLLENRELAFHETLIQRLIVSKHRCATLPIQHRRCPIHGYEKSNREAQTSDNENLGKLQLLLLPDTLLTRWTETVETVPTVPREAVTTPVTRSLSARPPAETRGHWPSSSCFQGAEPWLFEGATAGGTGEGHP
ncbi:hypothetical protein COCON_G00097480 [Conger conger]|uniref:Uncharacterized protein n=1 Tax=Conger conger TaxID=82655 RepID=A0A9Q1I1G0_CONCO|nr:hypothetical protein COCON_G00097480 [Conger conger]